MIERLGGVAAKLAFSVAMGTLVISSCSTADRKVETHLGSSLLGEADEQYLHLLEKYSREAYGYNGFVNVFEVRASLLTTEVLSAQVDRKAQEFQWTTDQISREKEKNAQEGMSRLQFFVSFFSPEPSHRDLTRKSDLWKIYLDVNGQRFVGDVQKTIATLPELQNLYPYHTQWNDGYLFTFLVPRSLGETQESKLTLTGIVGTQEMVFKPQ